MTWIYDATLAELWIIEGNIKVIPEIWQRKDTYKNLTPEFLQKELLLDIKRQQKKLEQIKTLLVVFPEEFEK